MSYLNIVRGVIKESPKSKGEQFPSAVDLPEWVKKIPKDLVGIEWRHNAKTGNDYPKARGALFLDTENHRAIVVIPLYENKAGEPAPTPKDDGGFTLGFAQVIAEAEGRQLRANCSVWDHTARLKS